MSRRKALWVYLLGTIGQMGLACFAVLLLRLGGVEMDYATAPGLLAIGFGGISSALWGAIVSVQYKKIPAGRILLDFVDVRQALSGYLLAAALLLLDFGGVLFGGGFAVSAWYVPLLLFLKALLFGGIEEIGWRYTFQPILEERLPYALATALTFLAWGAWHFLYFYLEGSLAQVQAGYFLLGLFVNCFLLSALYNRTGSLWLCAMTHALINTLSQITYGGSAALSSVGRGAIIVLAIALCAKKRPPRPANP